MVTIICYIFSSACSYSRLLRVTSYMQLHANMYMSRPNYIKLHAGLKKLAYNVMKASQNVSLFTFLTPIERWTSQVQRMRAGCSGPTATSYLCSNHFMENCFNDSSVMAAKLGIEKRKTCKPDALPTVLTLYVEQKPALPSIKKESCYLQY